MADADETVTYQFETDAELWSKWRATVPRTTPLYKRITALLELDAMLADENVQQRLVKQKFERVDRRAQTALRALAQDEPERVREELSAIQDIAAVDG